MNYPILLTPDGKYEAVLHNAYNIVVDDELLTTSTGYETLSFLISNNDPKRRLLNNERIIEVQGRRYIIRIIDDVKNNSNICTVTCDALWYDLTDGDLKHLMHIDAPSIDARTAVEQQLEGTGWTVGVVDTPGLRPRHTADDRETSLYNLRQISDNYRGDLLFDTVNKTVSLLANLGTRHQTVFCYKKNTSKIRRTVDTRNLFTRFTLVGKDADGNDVTISDINGGKDYVENYEWYDRCKLPRKLKWHRVVDDRWSNKENMLEYMTGWLEEFSKPVASYELNVSLFEVSPNLGDYVYVMDSDLNIQGWLRVVSRKKNILEPHSSTVQLETSKKTIVTAIVTPATISQQVQQTVSEQFETGATMPVGVEDAFMVYKNGRWQSASMIASEGDVMQYVNGQWTASGILGDINSIIDDLNGEVL